MHCLNFSTLSDWREQYPELEQRLVEARGSFREKALQETKKAVIAGDWRAAAKALEFVFPAEYRGSGSKLEVTATANAQASSVVETEEKLREIQARRQEMLREQQEQK